MNLVLIEPGELRPDGTARIEGSRARHLRMVIGVTIGQEVRVGVVDGASGVGVVRAVEDDGIWIECRVSAEVPPLPPIDLLLALPRPKVLQRLWAQLAAIGVGRIVITNAERVERNYFDTHVLEPSTYRPLFIEGLQQAKDTRVPVVSVHRRFRVLVEDELDGLCPQRARLAGQPGIGVSPLAIAAEAGRVRERLLIAVGPEGGWNDFELRLLTAHGFQLVSLGPRSLRTDTACLALMAIVQEGWRNASGESSGH